MKSPLAVFILCIAMLPTPQAQQLGNSGKVKRGTPSGLSEATETYQLFKENGILLVKIPTGSKKFTAIEQQLKKQPSARLNKYLVKEKEKLSKMRDSLLAGFRNYYRFSPVVAVYDTNYMAVLKNPNVLQPLMDLNLRPVNGYPLTGKKVLTFRMDRYVYDSNKSLDAFVLTDIDGKIIASPFPGNIPYKFKRQALMSDNRGLIPYRFPGGSPFLFRNQTQIKLYKRYSWKKVDKNPAIAVVKLLQLKLDTFQLFINYYSTKL